MSSREQQREVLDKIVRELARRRLLVVAIFALESMRPLSFIASQALVVLGPIVQSILSIKEYDLFCEALEDRSNVDWMIQRLEETEDNP